MDKRTLHILEYDKITEMLSAECCSPLTREAALRLVPSYKPYWIKNELNGTEEAVNIIMKRGNPPLGNFYDIEGSVHLAAKGGRLSLKQLLYIGYNLSSARKTLMFLAADASDSPVINNLISAVSVLRELENEIEKDILSEDELADNASPELSRIRKAKHKQNEAIRARLTKMANSPSFRDVLQDTIVTMRQGRYVLPVKLEAKNLVAGIVHDQSASGATLFIEPSVIVLMNNELRELELAEEQEIQRIIVWLSGWIGREELKIKGNQDILFKLDYLFAKGKLACKMHGSKPEINEDGIITIKKGRHPLIDKEKIVPIDVELGRKYDTLIITGPNTGGKTVTLKTVGLLCLMAQAGLFVPAGDGTSLPIFRNIYADIGDEQSIEQSLSTFSSHMKNIVEITKGADSDCLVLLDELGAGTDPTEGAALAISILEHIHSLGARIFATTHYTELKKYALKTDRVSNASMEFDLETLSPTYHLSIGVPGKSNAFEISKKLGLDEDIVIDAGRFLEKGDIAFEDVISSIEEEKKAAEKARFEAERLRDEMRIQKEKLDKLEERIKEQKELIIANARSDAKDIIDDARDTVKDLQSVLNEARNAVDSQSLKTLNKKFEDKKKRIREIKELSYADTQKPAEDAQPIDPAKLKAGDRVNVLSAGQKGIAAGPPDEKGNVLVSIGNIKLSVPLSGLSSVQENVSEKQRQKTMYSRLAGTKARTVPMSINVVGKPLDEAEAEVDKYIDDAFLAGLETVSIIHGRGAGILRNGLAQMLKRNKNVKQIRSGEYKEGGDGVTIVTLKK